MPLARLGNTGHTHQGCPDGVVGNRRVWSRGYEVRLWAAARGLERHSKDCGLKLQATRSQRMTRSDLSVSDERDWGTERRETGAWELLGRAWGPGSGFCGHNSPAQSTWSHQSQQFPRQGPWAFSASQNRRSRPPVFSGARCFRRHPSLRLPASPRLAPKQPFIPESQRSLRCRHSQGIRLPLIQQLDPPPIS